MATIRVCSRRSILPSNPAGLPTWWLHSRSRHSAWDAAGSVVDLSPFLNDPTLGLGSGGVADFPAVFWAQDNLGGKQLGIPAQRSARFLFYNKTWAHELGFTNPPATADEFRQQACAANASFRKDADPQNDGYGGWIVDTNWQTIYSWMLAFGGGVVDGNGSYGFQTDPNLAALQFLKTLYDDNCAWLAVDPTNPKDISHGPYFDQFAKRLALFVSGDLAEVPMATESMSFQKNADEWTLLPFPGTNGAGLVTYGPSFSVLKSTPEKELAAWLFIRWLLLPENQSQWVNATGLFPLTNSVLNTLGQFRSASPQWEAAVGTLALAQGVPQLASWRKVRYLLGDGADVIFETESPARSDSLHACRDGFHGKRDQHQVNSMADKPKFYVVWKGRKTGVFSSWEACAAQVQGFTGAQYKSFGSRVRPPSRLFVESMPPTWANQPPAAIGFSLPTRRWLKVLRWMPPAQAAPGGWNTAAWTFVPGK